MGPTRSWLAGAWPWAAVAAVFALGWLGALLWPGWGPASRAPERALAHGLAPLRKLEIPLPNAASGLASLSGLAISPDGTKLLYIADGSVWLRWLDRTGAPVLLAGKDVSDVFWSPRSTEVGFCRDGKLWTVPVSGGDPNLMCPFPRQQATGAAWIPGDQILFCMEKSGSTGHGLYAISATGDEPRLLIPFQEATVGQGIRPLLGTGGVIFVSYDQKRRRGTVDVWTPGGKRKTLLELPYTIGACTFAPPGHVLFNRLQGFRWVDQSDVDRPRRFDRRPAVEFGRGGVVLRAGNRLDVSPGRSRNGARGRSNHEGVRCARLPSTILRARTLGRTVTPSSGSALMAWPKPKWYQEPGAPSGGNTLFQYIVSSYETQLHVASWETAVYRLHAGAVLDYGAGQCASGASDSRSFRHSGWNPRVSKQPVFRGGKSPRASGLSVHGCRASLPLCQPVSGKWLYPVERYMDGC